MSTTADVPAPLQQLTLVASATIKGGQCPVEEIGVDPADSDFAAWVGDGTISFYNLPNQKKLWELDLNPAPGVDPVYDWKSDHWALDYLPDGKSLVVGGDALLRILSVDLGKTLVDFPLPTPAPFFTAAKTSADGLFIAAAGLRHIDPRTCGAYTLSWSEPCRVSDTKQFDQDLQVYSVATGKLAQTFAIKDSPIRKLGFSADLRLIYTASFTNVRIYNLIDTTLLYDLPIALVDQGTDTPAFLAVDVSFDNRFIAATSRSQLVVADTQEKKIVLSQALADNHFDTGISELRFCHDLTCVLGADGAGNIYSWSLSTGSLQWVAKKPEDILHGDQDGLHPWISFPKGEQFMAEYGPAHAADQDNTCPGFTVWQIPRPPVVPSP